MGRSQNPTASLEKCSEEQIIYALRSVEGGTKIGEVCRQLGVSEQTYFRWKKQYGDLGVSELRQPRDANSSLKLLVVDLRLDKRMLQEVLAKNQGCRASV